MILLPYHYEKYILKLLSNSNCRLPIIVIPSGSLKVAAGIYGTVCLVRLCSGVNRPPPTQLFVTPFSLGVGWSAKIQRLWNFKQGLNIEQTIKQCCFPHTTKSTALQHCRISISSDKHIASVDQPEPSHWQISIAYAVFTNPSISGLNHLQTNSWLSSNQIQEKC